MKNKILEKLSTQYMGRNIIYYQTIDSTQKEAKRILHNLINGTIILAEQQTDGIGTKGHTWYTGNNNIAMTVVLFPNATIKNIDGLTVKIAQCMVKTIQILYGYTIEIKMPNDLLIQGKKIGGILTQTHIQGEIVTQILIGIGLDVNGDFFPTELVNTATSLKKEFNQEFDRAEIISTFCNIFEKEYNILIPL